MLGQVCGLAVRPEALEQNPVPETSPISTKPKNPPRALTEAQALQLKALLTCDARRQHHHAHRRNSQLGITEQKFKISR